MTIEQQIATLSQELGIDCDFRRKPNYTYTSSQDQLDSLQLSADILASQRYELGPDDTPLQ